MYIYAILNKDNVCVGISYLSREVDKENMILINDSIYPLGQKYENGIWVEIQQDDVNLLEDCKKERVLESKTKLANWLEQHPLESGVHNNENAFYTVTQEKQMLLTQNILLAQVNQVSTTTWNCEGGVCEEWQVTELIKLAKEIEAYVRPRVKKQQTYEVQINVCTTVEEVEAIEIEYDTI